MQAAQDEGAIAWERFLPMADLLVAQAQRGKRPLVVLMIALDGYPIVESGSRRQIPGDAARAEGAEAGDGLEAILERFVRKSDLFGRHGATSFVLITSDTPWLGATLLAERLHAVIRAIKVPAASGPATISIGIATGPESDLGARELIRHAVIAVTEAMTSRGNQAQLYGRDGPDADLRSGFEQDQLAARREAALSYLSTAAELGRIASASLRTQPGACSACREAARKIYPVNLMPGLPLARCTSDRGCHCTYTLPALDGQSLLPSVPMEDFDSLNLPPHLRNAALAGSDPCHPCSPDGLAEYLESFPMLWFDELQVGERESVVLQRAGYQGWERSSALARVAQGWRVPLEAPLTSRTRDLPVPPSLPENVVYGTRPGTLYLTERQLVFVSESFREMIPLLQVTGIYYLQDAVACTLAGRDSRLVVQVGDPLPVSLYLARALRSALL